MQLRFLGARQGESRDSHFASILVDGLLALDAGGLTAALTLEEQAAVQSILITHHHFDHIKDLASFGFNRMGRGRATIYCTKGARAAVEATVLNEQIWINFFKHPTPEAPVFEHVAVQPGRAFAVGPYQVRPVPVKHSMPAIGYSVSIAGSGTFLYTGDNGPGSGIAWATAAPDLLITEVTQPDSEAAEAAGFGHLTSTLLVEELKVFHAARGYLPRVAVVHANPYRVDEVAREIEAAAAALSAEMWVVREDETATV